MKQQEPKMTQLTQDRIAWMREYVRCETCGKLDAASITWPKGSICDNRDSVCFGQVMHHHDGCQYWEPKP